MDSDSIPEHTPKRELSKVPSWIMLGFLIGGLFVFLLRREYLARTPVEPPLSSQSVEGVVVPKEPSLTEMKGFPSLVAIENVWDEWGSHAIWADGTTEFALWNTRTEGFTDFFEAVAQEGQVYFRSIPKLTRPIADRGLGKESPLLFTTPVVAQKR